MREEPHTSDMLTVHVDRESVKEVLRFLKFEAKPRYKRLDDLTAIDESARRDRIWNKSFSEAITDVGAAESYAQKSREPYPDFTLVYQLLSFDGASRLRIKSGLNGAYPAAASITDIWPSANWYEREVFDMFGITFEGHPNLGRILMPQWWEGHPLRKDYPGRATQMPPYTYSDARMRQPMDAGELMQSFGRFHEPLQAAAPRSREFFLNIGPHHVSTHGLLRCIAALEGEEIRELDLEIGYHHRAAEKLGERQSWHQYIPYTDRNDYLGGAATSLHT